MARPAKSVKTQTKHLTIEEKNSREKIEDRYRGGVDKLLPPNYLDDEQKNIFDRIVKELSSSEMLGNIDVYILSHAAVAIERLQYIEASLNSDIELLLDKRWMGAKDKYTKDLFRCCNELSLSPQARAKMASINLQGKKGDDPLLKLLSEDDDED